nr:M23 family metallopeptidase [Actinomycetota bacterium]
DELAAVLDSRTAVLDEQSARKAELSTQLAALRASLGIKKSRESHFESEIASTKDLLVEHQAKSAVAVLGTSNQGFIWPLNGSITSPYGPRWGSMHTGIDIDGVTGQPIVAAKEGQVVLASSYSGYGNAVILDHGGGYGTLYAHMSSFNTSAGAYVEQGDIIGYVGCTGSCTGDHLHFEVRVNGSPVDPMPYLP